MLADAIACFVNSSLGQAQIEVSISGSTGQTQLHRADVHRLQVPSAVLDNAAPIGKQYAERLSTYEPVTRQVRRRICQAEASITALLLLNANLNDRAMRAWEAVANEVALMEVLERLKPSMF